MADLATNTQIENWADTYQMGGVWPEQTAADRLKAVNTAEAVWRGYFWRTSPFDDPTVAGMLQYPLALHARAILEVDGEVADILPDVVFDILQPYLRRKIQPIRLAGIDS